MTRLMFFIGDRDCLVVKWHRGLPDLPRVFANSDEGRAQCEQYLEGMNPVTASILADLVEEDYRSERIPHLGWLDKKRFIGKKLEQYYRHTPFRNARIQGREGKEDRVLFSALTSPHLLLPWVELMAKRRIALSGICSIAMLGDRLIGSIPASHLMLLSFQEGTGLRQSFFLNGEINFSRLTLIHPNDDFAAVVQVESDRAYHYLHALSLLPEKKPLLVCILCGLEDKSRLQHVLEDTPDVHHVFIDLNEAAGRTGFGGTLQGSSAIPLFLHLLGADANQYGSEEHRHAHVLGQWLKAANAFSAALVVAGLVLSGFDLSRSMGMQRRAAALEAEADAIMLRNRHLLQPESGPDSPRKMKAAVLLSEDLASEFPQPGRLLGLLSRALDRFPNIRMNRISWQISRKPESAGGASAEAGLLEPGTRHVVISMEGEFFPFDGSYRQANEMVDRFGIELGKSGMSVTKTKLPLDLSPDASFVGKSGLFEDKATFSLRAVWKAAS